MATRWGIISTGKISNDFVRALSFLNSSEHKIVTVAARNKNDAISFAKEHGIPNVSDTYDDIATNDSVEIVYIGSVNNTHFSLCKRMLEAGKHVLCEKPMCLSYAHTEVLVKLAQEKKLFLMEAIWSRCFPLYDELRSILAQKKIGDVLYLRAEFGVPISEVPRVKKLELGGGTVYDLGVYVLQLATLVFGGEPEEVIASGNVNSEGVDTDVDCILKYPNGKACLSTHSKITMENCATIYGTNGSIKIKAPFWCPTVMVLPEGEKEFPFPFKSDKMNFVNSEGLMYEAQEARRCLQKGLIESPKITHQESLIIAKLEERLCGLLGAKVIDHN